MATIVVYFPRNPILLPLLRFGIIYENSRDRVFVICARIFLNFMEVFFCRKILICEALSTILKQQQ